MIATINLLWIIPLSALGGGFILTALLLNTLAQKLGGKHENKGSDQADRAV